MVTIKGYNISLPYGESFALRFTLTEKKSGEPYIIPEGSFLRFAVHLRRSTVTFIEKTAASEEQDEDGSVTFTFTSDDTKIGRDSYRYTLAVITPDADKCASLIGFQDDAVFAVESDCPGTGTPLTQPEIEVVTELAGEKLPDYDGSYIIEPSFDDDIVLQTAQKSLRNNVTVKKAVYDNNISFTSDGKFRYPGVVVIPNTVRSLQGNNYSGFAGHSEPMKISFEEGSAMTQIAPYAFYNCTGLTEIEFPPSITLFNGYLLSGCSSLKKVVFNSNANITNIQADNVGNPFYNCTSLEDIQIPENWTNSLTTVVISNGSANFTNVLTHDSMVAMLENLADLTGQTAKTLTLGATNLARLSEEEKAVATAKNWTLI